MPTDDRVRPKQGGTNEERLRYMLKEALKYASGDDVADVASMLASRVGAGRCPRMDGDCRPGACSCDGHSDALIYAVQRYREERPKS